MLNAPTVLVGNIGPAPDANYRVDEIGVFETPVDIDAILVINPLRSPTFWIYDCVFTPLPIPVTGVMLDESSKVLQERLTTQLTATVAPVSAWDQSVTWESSNPTVAAVNSDGIVSALHAGVSTITVTTNDGGFTDQCTVTVTAFPTFPTPPPPVPCDPPQVPAPLPDGIIPTSTPSLHDILIGDRTTSYRYEILTHDPTTGVDTWIGNLDGVQNCAMQLTWNASVKASGTINVYDIDTPAQGKLRVRDLNLVTYRFRPVLMIEGLPDIPLGVYIVVEAPETWTGEGRTIAIGVQEKTSVLDTDAVTETFVADTSKTILQWVQYVIQSAGETCIIDVAQTATVSTPMVWDPGTTKLQIVNDLLNVLNYNSLRVDGQGNFVIAPYVQPSSRPLNYDLLQGVPRELLYGEMYTPSWTRDKDWYDVPNRVVAVMSSGMDTPPISGVATNEDESSPYSYQSRGLWKTDVLTGIQVPDGDTATQTAFLQQTALQSLIASSSPQAAVEVIHLPIPIWVGDVIRFQNSPSGIDGLYVVTAIQIDGQPKGLMTTDLQEILSGVITVA